MIESDKVENWTEVIGPKRGLLEVNLKEIWRYRDLVVLFVHRDFVSTYKQTILGPLWLFIQPLFTTAIFVIVFSRVANLSTNQVPPVLFYLSGIIMWTYFSDCFTKTSNVFVSNAGIFGKVYFPRLTTPISIVLSNLVKLVIQLSLFVVILTYVSATSDFHIQFNWTIVLIPLLIAIMAGLGLGLGILFSSLTTKYRDLAFLLQFGIQLLMYATPVIYPLSSTSGNLRFVLSLNPLSPIIETFRYSVLNAGIFSPYQLLYSLTFTLVSITVGVLVFNQVEKSFMDTV